MVTRKIMFKVSRLLEVAAVGMGMVKTVAEIAAKADISVSMIMERFDGKA
jgi:hypothetical protein